MSNILGALSIGLAELQSVQLVQENIERSIE